MRKLIKLILVCMIVLSSFTHLVKETPVLAACNGYEVVDIQTNGAQNSIGCYTDINEAKQVMSGYTNGAIKHSASKSPEQFIAMTRGIVQSYPYRVVSVDPSKPQVTMTIQQYVSSTSNEKTTYVKQHYEMAYFGTYSYNPSNGNGRVRVGLAGFDGYADLYQLDLIPMVYIENGLTIKLGGNTSPSSFEGVYSNVPKHSYFKVENNELRFVTYSQYSSITYFNSVIGPKADWMSEGAIYYSWDLVNFYSDMNYVNKVGTYYNYYTFLPLRSKTNIDASQFNSFLNSKNKPNSIMQGKGQAFIAAQNEYGVNALLVYAMALHESGYGTSDIALAKNNLFGWNAVDSSPSESADAFPNVDACIRDQMSVNLRGYLDVNDTRFFGSHLGEKGSGFNVKYASDPYWGLSISSLAYSIDKSAGKVDLNKYSIGIINDYATPIKKEAKNDSSTLYNTAYGATYQKEFTAIVLSKNDSWSKIQSTNGIRSNGTLQYHTVNGTKQPAEAYNFDTSIGYVQTNKLMSINNSLPPELEGTTPTADVVQTITKLEWNSDKLSIEGSAYRPGIWVTDKNKLTQILSIEDEYLENSKFDLTTTIQNKFEATFKNNSIDISNLPVGRYKLNINSVYSSLTEFNNAFYIKSSIALPSKKEIGSKTFEFNVLEGTVVLDVKNKPIPNPIAIRSSVEKFSWKDSNTLLLKGIGIITGTNFDDLTKIKHEILLKNSDTKEVINLLANTNEGDYLLDLYDGFNYKYGWYEIEIDMSTVPLGNYELILKVTNGDEVKQTNLNSIEDSLIPETKQINGNTIKIRQYQPSRFRYEIEVRKGNLVDMPITSLPTKRNSLFDYEKLNLENGVLTIDGLGLIWNADFADAVNATHKMLLQDDGGNVFTYDLNRKTCAVNYTELLNSRYDLTNICYDASIDLKTMSNGKYIMYLDISTSKYRDVFEIFDLYSRKIESVTINGKIYTIQTSPIRYRLELTIKDV